MTNNQQRIEREGGLTVLVGDDQIGVTESMHQKAFLRGYAEMPGKVRYEFTADAEEFIRLARTGKYDALVTDLNWSEEDSEREYKTGFRILEAVKGLAPVILLHTSDDTSIALGIRYGATRCIPKNKGRDYFWKALNGLQEDDTQKMSASRVRDTTTNKGGETR